MSLGSCVSSSTSSFPWPVVGVFPFSPRVSGTLRFFCLGCCCANHSLGKTGIPWTRFGIGCELGVGIVCGFLFLAIASVSGDYCSSKT